AGNEETTLEELSDRLGLPVDTISARLKAKQEKIGEKILGKESIDLLEYMKVLDMKKGELIRFVDSLNRPYLELGNKIIFSPAKIKETKGKIRSDIIRDSRRSARLSLAALQGTYKLTSSTIGEILEELIEDGKVSGFWINGDLFLTEFGIEQTLLEQSTAGMFWIDDIFEDHELDDAERGLVEEVLQTLISKKALDGTYNSEDGSFFTFDAKEEMDKNMAIQGLDAVYNGIVEKVEGVMSDIGKLVLGAEGVKPQLMQKIEDTIEETVKKMVGWERELQNFVYRRSRFIPGFKEDLEVKAYLEEFDGRKKLLWSLENKFPEIVGLKTRLKINPDNKDAKKELDILYRRFGFVE
ncbi:MAG: hypothetical protein ACTSU5_08540, partial [Promethearchaeota archaeon]